MPEIKICGLTKICEADYINEAKADYAGFVFYEKSKRNVSVESACKIAENLDKTIRKVAVCVSPDLRFAQQIAEAGFDILQVHGVLTKAVASCGLPIWRAVNIGGAREPAKSDIMTNNADKIAGVVVDGANYGGGKTFCWDRITADRLAKEMTGRLNQKKFILAGGLHAGNVAQGIRLFHPDVVDVSSGVEEKSGKGREKIIEFVREVRRNG